MLGSAKLPLLAALLSAAPLLAGGQDFTLHNETGVVIQQLFVSPSNVNDWQEDVLGVDALPSGESVDIHFDRAETAALWDLKITDAEGTSIEWKGLNLLALTDVTLHFEDGQPTATVENGDGEAEEAATGGAQDFELVNATGVVIHELHLSPSNVDDWQEDVLGVDQLGDGETAQITFQPSEQAALWDLKITDTEGTTVTWTKLDLLRISQVTLKIVNGQALAETK